MPSSLNLSLRCRTRDIFAILAPLERKGFSIVDLHARGDEAAATICADEAAIRAAQTGVLPSLLKSLPSGASLTASEPATCFELSDALTIILTTSPAPIQPSTTILDQVLQSLAHYAPELQRCRLLITCDGCNDVRPGQKVKFRSGIVDTSGRTNYDEYVDTLRADAAAGGREGFAYELLELRSRHGFGGAVRAALAHVRTPLVLVVQHDRTLLRPVDVAELAAHVLASDGAVGYALLPVSKHVDHLNKERTWLGERGVRGADADLAACARALPSGGRQLLPCLAWHDSTHVASVAYYQQLFRTEKSILGFIESGLGPRQAVDAVALGVPRFVDKWRTYVLDDGVAAAMVDHLDGSSDKGRRWQPTASGGDARQAT